MRHLDTPHNPAPKASHRLALLPALVFVVMLLAGLGVTLASLRQVPDSAWVGMTAPKAWLDGESTRRFTANLNTHFLPSKFFAQVERAVTWTLVGDTGTQVRTGCPDWFFLAEELELFPHAAQSAQARADIVSAVSESLKAKGITLVVALVPDKSRVEHTHLCGLHRSPAFAGRLSQWQAALTQAGVNVINLEPVLQALPGERYYRTDSHWNEVGAEAAAAAIARHVQAGAGQTADVAPVLVTQNAAVPGNARLIRRMVDRPGDLLRLSNLEGLPTWLRPATEKAQLTTIAPVATSAAPAPEADDLFGDAGLPTVVVLGTSFSRTSNFVPFFSFYLGAQVANLAKDGANFEGATMAYLSSSAYQKTPPKTVLWEVPERMLQKPLSKDEQQWMRQLALSPIN